MVLTIPFYLNARLAGNAALSGTISFYILMIKPHLDLTELNAELLNELLVKITVGKRLTSEDGEVQQRIRIIYKYGGDITNDFTHERTVA